MIVAHRGASKDAPENSLSAFHLAWTQEADAIETDVHVTADGDLVCMHDATTKRTSDRDLTIAKETTANLRRLSLKGRPHKESIPLLTELLATVPEGKRLYIELKSGANTLAPLEKELAQSNLTPEQIVVISFHDEVIQALTSTMPEIRAYWLHDLKEVEADSDVSAVLDRAEEIGAKGMSIQQSRIDKEVARAVADRGLSLHAWTVDNPERAAHLISIGVASITTNVPGMMRKALSERSEIPQDL